MRRRAGSSSIFDWWLLGLVTAGSLLVALGLVFASGGYRAKPTPEAEVSRAVEDIRSRVSSITLEESQVVFKDVPQPRFQYKLTINLERGTGGGSSVYLFDVYRYTLTTGGDESKVPTSNLCELVDAVYDRKDPILEALRELKLSGKVTFPVWKVFGGEIEAGNITPILVETLYSLRKFVELRTTHAEIMVRGYADGQHGRWDEPMEPGYAYDRIPVYQTTDSHPGNQNVFIKEEQFIPVHDQHNRYKNEHLPDLRAHFVKEALVEPYFALCRQFNPEAHVLKGFEFKELLDHPEERKVQVFILIYDNKPSE